MEETIIETQDLKLGDTTFKTSFKVTVPDYGAPIPEAHTTSPIINPIRMKLYIISNLIERGLHVQFVDKQDVEKMYFFIKLYNETAAKINKEAQETLNPLALETENYLAKKLRFHIHKDNTEIEKEIKPDNPFKQQYKIPKVYKSTNVYNNENIINKLKGKNNKSKAFVDNRDLSEYKMYEMFSHPGAIGPDGQIINNPNTNFTESIPQYYDEMELGE